MPNIRRRGDKWQVQFRRRGISPVTRSFINKKDAETWARQIEVQADRQDLPADPKQLTRLTLGDLVKRYLKSESPRKKGYDIEKMVLSAFLNHSICSKRLSDITPADFANYRDERLKAIKPRSLQRQLSPLHNMFKVARNEWGLPVRENPLDKVKLDCPNNRRERRLRDGELERIIKAANKLRNPITLPVILFALQTAMRRSEILLAKWSDLNMKNRVLIIPMSKNGHSRAIPLTLSAMELLNGLKEQGEADKENERIFPTTANALGQSWDRLTAKAGVTGLHFHDLRHEAISHFFELGLTAPEVALISGHRDMRMLYRYAHPQLARVVKQLDQHELSVPLVFKERRLTLSTN